ncbi:MAG TPA: YHS domain-containing protein [Pyrinomonadaceae bacterium]|jgi:Cu+-exporting ATPase
MAKHVDPICGMPVEEERAAGRSEYRGRDYYFCSAGCRERFNEDPGRYAADQGREGAEQGAR